MKVSVLLFLLFLSTQIVAEYRNEDSSHPSESFDCHLRTLTRVLSGSEEVAPLGLIFGGNEISSDLNLGGK